MVVRWMLIAKRVEHGVVFFVRKESPSRVIHVFKEIAPYLG